MWCLRSHFWLMKYDSKTLFWTVFYICLFRHSKFENQVHSPLKSRFRPRDWNCEEIPGHPPRNTPVHRIDNHASRVNMWQTKQVGKSNSIQHRWWYTLHSKMTGSPVPIQTIMANRLQLSIISEACELFTMNCIYYWWDKIKAKKVGKISTCRSTLAKTKHFKFNILLPSGFSGYLLTYLLSSADM